MPVFYEPSSILGAPNAEFVSPGDFSVAYTSEKTLTLSGAPVVADDSELVYVMVVPATGQAKMYINGIGGVALRLAGAVLTLEGVPRPFATGDKYRMGIGAKQSVVLHGDINVDSTSVDTSGLSGKVSGGDFDTAYSAATDIACTNMPTYHPTLIDSDIVTIFQINASGVVVETYSRDDMPMTVVGNVITVTGASFGATDVFVVYTNIERYFDSVNLEMVDGANVDVGAGNAGAGTQRVSLSSDDVNLTAILAGILAEMAADKATHTSPNDFTATFTSSTTITLAGYPSDLVSGVQIVKISQSKADNSYAEFVNLKNCKLDFAAGVITIYGAGTPFVTGDEYRIGLLLQDKATDVSQNVLMTSEQSPEKDWNTDYVPLVTEQDLTISEAAYGSSIDVREVNILAVEIIADVNTSQDCTLHIYTQQTSGSTESTPQGPLPSSVVLWSGLGSDFVHTYYFDVTGDTFVQLKAVVGTLGTAGDLSISIRKAF